MVHRVTAGWSDTMSKDLFARDRDITFGGKGKPTAVSGHLGPLMEAVDRVLPPLEQLTTHLRTLSFVLQNMQRHPSCTACEKRETCHDLCNDLKRLLPGINHGRPRHEHLASRYIEELCEIQDRRRVGMFEPYERCKDHLTDKQYQAAYLFFHEGRTHEHIATLLNRSRSSVTNLLKRARIVKESYEREMREHRRNYQSGDNPDET